MNALLVYPQHPLTFWSFKYALKIISKKAIHPPLGLLTVAALLPKQWQLKLVDLNVQAWRDQDLEWADMVLVSAMGIQRKSTEEVLRKCRQYKVPVLAGGPLFTSDYEAFENGVDVFVLGEAESVMPQVIADWEHGTPKHIYQADDYPSLQETPLPRWDLINMKKYAMMDIQYSRGCPFDCDFCDITNMFGRKVRTKTTAQFIGELENLYQRGWRGDVFVVDDNFIGNTHALKTELLPAMQNWMQKRKKPFSFGTEVSINLADDDELLRKMVQAGFNTVFVGIETPNEKSLKECSKRQNQNRDMLASVKKIQHAGLMVHGGFIVGFDHDSPNIFEQQIDFIRRSGIITAMVGLLNAPKGTRLYQRIVKEGRLLSRPTGDNTDFSINFIPKMGMEKLSQGYQHLIQGIYSSQAYYHRVKEFLSEYQPIAVHKPRWRFSELFSMLRAFAKSVAILGICDKERWHFWKLFFWSAFRRPQYFSLALTLAVYGYHFRHVFARCL